MTYSNCFARLGVAAALAIASTGALAVDPSPGGTWTGTIKCDAKVQDGIPTKFSVTSTVAMYAIDPEPIGFVCGRFSGVPIPVPEAAVYLGAYIPDAPGATKGTLGFATDPLLFDEVFGGFLPYSETGQTRLELKKDGKVVLNGKSFVLAESPGGALSASCEWKLNKFSDVVEDPGFPYPPPSCIPLPP